jgi:chromosome segregation protein
MRLSRLEIVGFKSFLNKTRVNFEPGVTAIVGPNGCGKSNVVDAIKWVFGEQSPKSMRSSTMQDVIFNGTEKFDPVNMSEVSITLSNEDRALSVDYDEVTITRRLFRDGESEYLINKTAVRLTDIRNILMGTGMGTSSYSVIEQGKMDLILSSKPEDRRYVFEEASGITKYKSQKREALSKLERVQENLTRINDIVREVERQINTIERQARKAERYKAMFEELKGLEVKLSYKRFNELSTDGTGADVEMEKIVKLADSLKAEVDSSAAELSGNREEYNNLMEDLQTAQNSLMQISSEIERNDHTIGLNRERINDLERNVQRLDWEIEEASERVEVLEKRLEEMETRSGMVRERRQTKESDLLAVEEKIKGLTGTIEKQTSEMRSKRQKTVDLLAEQTQTKNELIRINADMQNAHSRQRRLDSERANVSREKEAVAEKMREIENAFDGLKASLADMQDAYNVFSSEYMIKQGKLSSLKEERYNKQKRVNEIRPRREFLEKLISEREGINDNAKEILKLVESGDEVFRGVHGVLSEIVSVHGGYEEALESILGDFTQALVVENRETAERISMYLSGKLMGSVSFVILSELLGEDVGKPAGKSMAEVVNVTGDYDKAVKALLSDIFVAEDGEHMCSVPGEGLDSGKYFVSQKGEITRKGMYRSRNYSGKEVFSLFGRQDKLEHLVSEEKGLVAEIVSLDAAVKELEEWVNESNTRKDNLETKLREKQVEFADMSSKRSVTREKLDNLGHELTLIRSEIEEEGVLLKELVHRTEQLDVRLKEFVDVNLKFEEEIDFLQKNVQNVTFERESELYKRSDLKSELSGMIKEEEHTTETLAREKENFQRLEKDIVEKKTRIVESREKIKSLNSESVALDVRTRELAAQKEVFSVDIAARKSRKDGLLAGITELAAKVRQKEEKLESVRNQIRDVDVRRKELEYKRAGIAERMADHYKVDITTLSIELEEAFNEPEAEVKVAELRDRLDKMGEVSLGAVEEHKQLEERFAFLTKQRDDLTKSREDIMDAITKINRTTRKMFVETFEAIRKEFNVYFRMLFNGGKAELILEDENEILESGIDIIVRPPGKKLQNIMLLSGGEKAMTAIALVFAIFKVNPSPFCILDEIDAPLDESNVVRFCNVLREFLKLSQFIIVTHNKMTMKLADILYGITMEEKGVSKVVSVKFSQSEEREAIPAPRFMPEDSYEEEEEAEEAEGSAGTATDDVKKAGSEVPVAAAE